MVARRKGKKHPDRESDAGEWPRFAVVYCPRHPMQTDAQYEVGRRWDEEWALTMGIMLGLAQREATALGYHRDCQRRACRRANACMGRRAEDDWTVFPGPMFPPCCGPLEKLEPVRRRIREGGEQKASNDGE